MKINLNIDELIEELNLPSNTAELIVKECVEEVTLSIFESWKRAASNNLNSTRTGYIEGLNIIKTSEYSRQILLSGKLNNMLEKGAQPFDMKEIFRKSDKVKYSTKTDKFGNVIQSWYLTIPFRIGVPTTLGENSAFTSVMPREVYKIMKDKSHNGSLRKSEIPSGFDIPKARERIYIPSKNIDIPEYKHKTSPFEGLTKKTGAYEKTNQNTYVSFRRVGENSDPNSWIHRGIKTYNLLGEAINNTDINTVTENKVDEILEKLGYGK